MRNSKRFISLAGAVLALSAIGAANAPAAEFTASATGQLTGKSVTTPPVWTFNGGQFKCTSSTQTGEIKSTAFSSLHVTNGYSGCVMFGLPAQVPGAFTPVYHANGTVDFPYAMTVYVPAAFCSVEIPSQSALSSVTWENNSGKLLQKVKVTGITYTTTGPVCGASGTNGTFTANNELARVGGGSLSFDP